MYPLPRKKCSWTDVLLLSLDSESTHTPRLRSSSLHADMSLQFQRLGRTEGGHLGVSRYFAQIVNNGDIPQE